MSNYVAWIVLAFFGSQISWASDPSAKEIMKKHEEALRLGSFESEALLITGEAGRAERIKQFHCWKKLTEDQIHYKTTTYFKLPAEIREEAIVFLERPGNENEIRMYLPRFKKLRKIESRNQSGSFMASELSYSDIATPHLEDFQYRLTQKTACPGTENTGKTCYVIEETPAKKAVQERLGIQKRVSWVREDHFMIVQSETYNEQGELYKRLQFSEIKLLDPDNQKWFAHQVHIENLKNKRTTTLQFTQVRVNQPIDESIFNPTQLAHLKKKVDLLR